MIASVIAGNRTLARTCNTYHLSLIWVLLLLVRPMLLFVPKVILETVLIPIVRLQICRMCVCVRVGIDKNPNEKKRKDET